MSPAVPTPGRSLASNRRRKFRIAVSSEIDSSPTKVRAEVISYRTFSIAGPLSANQF